jgi:hypothetical protein
MCRSGRVGLGYRSRRGPRREAERHLVCVQASRPPRRRGGAHRSCLAGRDDRGRRTAGPQPQQPHPVVPVTAPDRHAEGQNMTDADAFLRDLVWGVLATGRRDGSAAVDGRLRRRRPRPDRDLGQVVHREVEERLSHPRAREPLSSSAEAMRAQRFGKLAQPQARPWAHSSGRSLDRVPQLTLSCSNDADATQCRRASASTKGGDEPEGKSRPGPGSRGARNVDAEEAGRERGGETGRR